MYECWLNAVGICCLNAQCTFFIRFIGVLVAIVRRTEQQLHCAPLLGLIAILVMIVVVLYERYQVAHLELIRNRSLCHPYRGIYYAGHSTRIWHFESIPNDAAACPNVVWGTAVWARHKTVRRRFALQFGTCKTIRKQFLWIFWNKIK